jgi:hypothetical protein
MKDTITSQVVRLDGNLTSLIMQNRAGDIGNIDSFPGELPMPQHLYFTSDEPIQDGNWMFERGEWGIKSVCQSMGNWTKEDHLKYPNDKKIVASTNLSLGLPAIPTAWVRDVYVRSNGTIMEVQLEMEEHPMNKATFAQNMYQLKLTDNNEVTVVNWHDGKIWNEIWLGEPQPCILGSKTDPRLEKDSYINVEFNYFLKHVVPTDKRKTWAKENWPKVVHSSKPVDHNHSEELEDAAKKYALSIDRGHIFTSINEDVIDDFKAGAAWQKEQSVTEAIEFAEWTRSQEDLGYIPEDKIWGYVTRDENGEFTDDKEYTSKQLYELWQQLRKKKSSSNSEHRSGR